MIHILRHRQFKKDFKKLPSPVRQKLFERLNTFVTSPFSPVLNNHALSGVYRGYRSINITGDYRVIFDPLDENTLRLMRVGTHPQLYE